MSRDASTYRAARRAEAKRQGIAWRDLPSATLRLKHSKAHIRVHAVPKETTANDAHSSHASI